MYSRSTKAVEGVGGAASEDSNVVFGDQVQTSNDLVPINSTQEKSQNKSVNGNHCWPKRKSKGEIFRVDRDVLEDVDDKKLRISPVRRRIHVHKKWFRNILTGKLNAEGHIFGTRFLLKYSYHEFFRFAAGNI